MIMEPSLMRLAVPCRRCQAAYAQELQQQLAYMLQAALQNMSWVKMLVRAMYCFPGHWCVPWAADRAGLLG
jgi:hypothetical protein